jgi:hypothetical protein
MSGPGRVAEDFTVRHRRGLYAEGLRIREVDPQAASLEAAFLVLLPATTGAGVVSPYLFEFR